MPVLTYKILEKTKFNEISTTGAEEGVLSILIKTDNENYKAQVYSELVANRLAMFLGIPVALGVPAKHSATKDRLSFASLIAFEDDREIYDFTHMDHRSLEPPRHVPKGILQEMDHLREVIKLTKLYPLETAFLTVFDYWVGNEDRSYNFKAELSKGNRGIIFALDHGSSLLACKSTIDQSLEQLEQPSYPRFHPFQKMVNPLYAGEMIERIINMPDWAIESATIFDEAIGNVIPMDQIALFEVLRVRKMYLRQQIQNII